MANTIQNIASYSIVGDNVSLTAVIPLGFTPTTATYISAYTTTGDATSNVASVVISGTNLNVTFVAAFSGLVTLLVSITPVVPTVLIENSPTVAIAGTSTVEIAGIVGTSTVEVAGIVGTSTVVVAGTSTVEVAGIIGTSTVVVSGIIGTSTVEVAGIVGTSTVAVTGQIAGPVAAGTAASSSVLTGLVYNTAAPAPTNGQQVAKQSDSAGNQRVNVYGGVGSFKNASVTSTITASATLQVAAATKWDLKNVRFAAIPSNTVTKQAVIWVTDQAGNLMWETAGPVFTPTNTLLYECLLSPTTPPGNPLGSAAVYAASGLGTNTQVVTMTIPEMYLGPSFQVNGKLSGAAGTATYTLSANVLQLSD